MLAAVEWVVHDPVVEDIQAIIIVINTHPETKQLKENRQSIRETSDGGVSGHFFVLQIKIHVCGALPYQIRYRRRVFLLW